MSLAKGEAGETVTLREVAQGTWTLSVAHLGNPTQSTSTSKTCSVAAKR